MKQLANSSAIYCGSRFPQSDYGSFFPQYITETNHTKYKDTLHIKKCDHNASIVYDSFPLNDPTDQKSEKIRVIPTKLYALNMNSTDLMD